MDIVEVVEEDQIMTLEEMSDEQEVIFDDDSEVFPYENIGFYNLDFIDDVNCTDGTYKPLDLGKGADISLLTQESTSLIMILDTEEYYTRSLR